MASGETTNGKGQGDGTGRLLAGRYRVRAQLGRGGMGVVWRAVDEVLGREVAVKELRTYTDADGPELADLRLRMQREARAAARVRHPGVVAVHDVAEVDGRPLIVMELVDGPSLDDVLRERGALDPREAARVGAKVMDALAAAHRAGVLHRDVKPGNILLERSGRVVLTDFGIATMDDPGDGSATHLTRSGEIVGSLDYLAPERAQGAEPGPASDVWALGATLFAAVEGSSPFRRTSTYSTLAAIVTEPLPELLRAGALGPVLQRLLDKRPEARPEAEQARELLQAVADMGGADTPTTTLRGEGETEPRPGTERSLPVVPPGFGPAQPAGATEPDTVPRAGTQGAGTQTPDTGPKAQPGLVFPVFGTPGQAAGSTGQAAGSTGQAAGSTEHAGDGPGSGGQAAHGPGSGGHAGDGSGPGGQGAYGPGSGGHAQDGSGPDGQRAYGPGSGEPSAHGFGGHAGDGSGPDGQRAYGPGSGEPSAHGPIPDGPYAHGQPSAGQAAHGTGSAEQPAPGGTGQAGYNAGSAGQAAHGSAPAGHAAHGFASAGQAAQGPVSGRPTVQSAPVGFGSPGVMGPYSASAPTVAVPGSLPPRRRGRVLLAAAAVVVVLAAAGTTVAVLNARSGTQDDARSAGSGSSAPASGATTGRTDADRSGGPQPTKKKGDKGSAESRDPGEKGGAEPTGRATSSAPAKSSGGGTTGGSDSGGSSGGGSGGGTSGGGSGNGGTTAGGGSTAGGGGSTSPAPSCTSIGGGKYNCTVWRTAKSYTASGAEAGVLNAGTNYFFCQQNLGRRETYGQWTNVWWAKTDDDSGNTNVYVSDVYIKGGNNDEPVPGLPVC